MYAREQPPDGFTVYPGDEDLLWGYPYPIESDPQSFTWGDVMPQTNLEPLYNDVLPVFTWSDVLCPTPTELEYLIEITDADDNEFDDPIWSLGSTFLLSYQYPIEAPGLCQVSVIYGGPK